MGAFTILAELVLLTCRLISRETALASVAGELGVAALTWLFWIGTYSTHPRSLLKRLSIRDHTVVTLLFRLRYRADTLVAAAISITITTTDGRSFCRHLNDLFDVPELENLDPAEIGQSM